MKVAAQSGIRITSSQAPDFASETARRNGAKIATWIVLTSAPRGRVNRGSTVKRRNLGASSGLLPSQQSDLHSLLRRRELWSALSDVSVVRLDAGLIRHSDAFQLSAMSHARSVVLHSAAIPSRAIARSGSFGHSQLLMPFGRGTFHESASLRR